MELPHNRACGCLAGLALGDALGMPVEFLSRQEIVRQYGWVDRLIQAPTGHPHRGFALGSISDDTGQALAIARAYEEGGVLTAEAAARELVGWAGSLSPQAYRALAGPSTRQAIELLVQGAGVPQSGRYGTTNGAAMRAAPVGLANPGRLEAALSDAVAASLPTHGTTTAISGAAAVACAVSEAVAARSTLESILQAGKTGAEKGRAYGAWHWGTPLEGRIELAERVVRENPDPLQALELLGRYVGADSLVAESVAAAFGIVLLSAGDPMRAVILGANLGGDTDSVAAMAGAICGAWRGIEAIDPGLLSVVEAANHLHLAETAARLVQIADQRRKNDLLKDL